MHWPESCRLQMRQPLRRPSFHCLHQGAQLLIRKSTLQSGATIITLRVMLSTVFSTHAICDPEPDRDLQGARQRRPASRIVAGILLRFLPWLSLEWLP